MNVRSAVQNLTKEMYRYTDIHIVIHVLSRMGNNADLAGAQCGFVYKLFDFCF
jgi:hypothetical protein